MKRTAIVKPRKRRPSKSRAMKRVVVIDGHPDPDEGRYVHALAQAYMRGAHQAGHGVELIRLASLDFPMLRSNADFYGGSVPADIRRAQQSIINCDHVVMLYPLWLGNMPALLKAFLEQVFRRAVAYSEAGNSDMSRNLLRGKSARIVVTMAMPAAFYRQHFGTHSLRSLRRHVAGFLGISPIRTQIIGNVESMTHAERTALIDAMQLSGRSAK